MPYSLADSCVFLSSVFIIHQCWRVMKIVAFSSKRRQRPGFLSSSPPFCSSSPRSFFSVVSAIVWNCVVLHGITLRHFGSWTAFTITDYLVNASINSLTGIVEAIRAEKCITRRVRTCVHSGWRHCCGGLEASDATNHNNSNNVLYDSHHLMVTTQWLHRITGWLCFLLLLPLCTKSWFL